MLKSETIRILSASLPKSASERFERLAKSAEIWRKPNLTVEKFGFPSLGSQKNSNSAGISTSTAQRYEQLAGPREKLSMEPPIRRLI